MKMPPRPICGWPSDNKRGALRTRRPPPAALRPRHGCVASGRRGRRCATPVVDVEGAAAATPPAAASPTAAAGRECGRAAPRAAAPAAAAADVHGSSHRAAPRAPPVGNENGTVATVTGGFVDPRRPLPRRQTGAAPPSSYNHRCFNPCAAGPKPSSRARLLLGVLGRTDNLQTALGLCQVCFFPERAPKSYVRRDWCISTRKKRDTA